MKTIIKYFEAIMITFITLSLLQSCEVYKPTLINLEQASKIDHKVKIMTRDGRTLYFNKIIKQGNNFYGIKKRQTKKITLFENDIEKVKFKDKSMSIVLNIGLPLILIGGPFLIYAGAI